MSDGWTPRQVGLGLGAAALGYAVGHGMHGLGLSWPAVLGAVAGAGLVAWSRGQGGGGSRRTQAVKVKLPFGIGEVSLVPDTAQRDLAWWCYVQLRTRVATVALEGGDERVALKSLYTFFTGAREQLIAAGPAAGVSLHTVGGTVLAVLNDGLRPFLSRWHPQVDRLKDAELAAWEGAPEFRTALAALQAELRQYLDGLEQYLPEEPRRRRLLGL